MLSYCMLNKLASKNLILKKISKFARIIKSWTELPKLSWKTRRRIKFIKEY